MEKDQLIFNDLWRLRQSIKEQEKQKTGRMPSICKDESLHGMAVMHPKKLSDLESIPGIGKGFIDRYGNDFLAIIKAYDETTTEKSVNLNASTIDILKELEKKLVNINKRNRLLYMPKIMSKYAVDLFDVGEKKLNDLLTKSSAVTVCNRAPQGKAAGERNEVQYKKFVQLLREVNKDLRDKGKNDLYVAYPFVTGNLPGEQFHVRAPLALFPVSMEKDADEIRLQRDDSRDMLYNTVLVLAYFKFNNLNNPLPEDCIDTYQTASFFDELISYYAENGLTIQNPEYSWIKFTEYTAKEFPKYHSGELYLEPCVVVGKFPVCDSSIQKDFDAILQSNEINVLLHDLLANEGDIDIYADQEEECSSDNKKTQISEKDLIYINDLNSSQEVVLSELESFDELVVQGPPGTGKSQTITSLIADFVCRGKNVLMVSEKKTALDVVYSRLGTLSRYALLIDDVGNKDLFYRQLNNMLTDESSCFSGQDDIRDLSESVDEAVSRLTSIAEQLYEPGTLGVEPYRLYHSSEYPDLNNEQQREKVRKINSGCDPGILEMPFDRLEKIHSLFEDREALEKLARFREINDQYPWIGFVRDNLSGRDVMDLEDRVQDLKNLIHEWKNKNFLLRLLTKSRVKKETGRLLEDFFSSCEAGLRDFVIQEIDGLESGINDCIPFQKLRPLYDRLSPEEQNYLLSVIRVQRTCQDELSKANDDLFNNVLCEHIDRFEASHRLVFSDIDNFDSLIGKIGRDIAAKQVQTKKKLEDILSDALTNLITSKRSKEIARALDSKRKWSVNKFINKFDFEMFKSVKIWLLTPEVVSEIIPLQKGVFDLVVFDEASQMYVERGVPSVFRAKKVVIAGDHKQLRPSSLGAGRTEMDLDDLGEDEEVNSALEEESLLDLARFKYRDIMLNFHYRSQYEELIAFSNYAFYKGNLRVSPNAVDPELPPIEVHQMEDARWEKRANRSEAVYIVELLRKFFKERKHQETVGIITFNSSQRDLIDDLIDEACVQDVEFADLIRTETGRRKDGEDIGLFVKNIESVQGDERDVIIFSIGYAKNEAGKLVRNFGWLNQRGGENRLNVAISRAKKKIHVVTSFHPSELQVDDMKNDGPRILKKYLEYSFAVSERNSHAARQILLSFGNQNGSEFSVSDEYTLSQQVRSALEELGYQVESNVGIGGYSIDLAVRKNGKYLLGIECDGRLYERSKSARDRDYHRQKYLEARGWKIYRLWSSRWWKNAPRELQKIQELIG